MIKLFNGIKTISGVIGGFFIGVLLMTSSCAPDTNPPIEDMSKFDHILHWETVNLPRASTSFPGYIARTKFGWIWREDSRGSLVIIDPDHTMFESSI